MNAPSYSIFPTAGGRDSKVTATGTVSLDLAGQAGASQIAQDLRIQDSGGEIEFYNMYYLTKVTTVLLFQRV